MRKFKTQVLVSALALVGIAPLVGCVIRAEPGPAVSVEPGYYYDEGYWAGGVWYPRMYWFWDGRGWYHRDYVPHGAVLHVRHGYRR